MTNNNTVVEKIKLTPAQVKVLNAMAYDLYTQSNGSTPTEFTDVNCGAWNWSVRDGAEARGVKKTSYPGVIAGLIAKGLAFSVDYGTKDHAVGMTGAGYAAWQTVDERKQ